MTTRVTADDVVSAINGLGGRFVGISASDNAPSVDITNSNAAYSYLAYVADQTTSNVPGSVFGSACTTGLGGIASVPDGPGGTCRLVMPVATSSAGIGTAIVSGVNAALDGLTFDVFTRASPDAGSTTDAVDTFISTIQPRPAGGADAVSGATCATIAAPLADRYHTAKALSGPGDVPETIVAARAASHYCVDVAARSNTTVAATASPQVFRATINALGERPTGVPVPLGSSRDVMFIVPPSLR